MALTAKQEQFCLEYLVDLNATQAAIRAGYSADTAYSIGHENLSKPELQDRVSALQAERRIRNKIDADYVLRQAVKIHERCMSETKPDMIAPNVQRTDDDGNPVFKFDASSAVRSLELVGKHISVQAFNEKLTLDANVTATIDLSGLTDDQVRALATIPLPNR